MASPFGGTRNGLAVSWPQGIGAAGEQRSQFHHVIDIAPTILDAAGIAMPAHVNGVEQALASSGNLLTNAAAAFPPEQSRSLLDRTLRWLQDHNRPIMVVVGLGSGAGSIRD